MVVAMWAATKSIDGERRVARGAPDPGVNSPSPGLGNVRPPRGPEL
jgi:hypothetical protein